MCSSSPSGHPRPSCLRRLPTATVVRFSFFASSSFLPSVRSVQTNLCDRRRSGSLTANLQQPPVTAGSNRLNGTPTFCLWNVHGLLSVIIPHLKFPPLLGNTLPVVTRNNLQEANSFTFPAFIALRGNACT
ncbi:unnamed protein product [Victoria cruziana]